MLRQNRNAPAGRKNSKWHSRTRQRRSTTAGSGRP
uniref:Uncharacterized protein n=1 Tax=Siphoviridae sp. ctx254 TaxID=2825737 RepID=A0A8S5TVP6_9CAUD|nr:MAG TPA: hypothetical protein [Siphoviridae sp. ctx254]